MSHTLNPYPTDYRPAFACSLLLYPLPCQVVLRLPFLWVQVGSADQAKVYLNGREIYQSRAARQLDWLDTVGPVALEEGTNVLLFKVVNEALDWEGCVRLVDEASRPAQGIREKLTPE